MGQHEALGRRRATDDDTIHLVRQSPRRRSRSVPRPPRSWTRVVELPPDADLSPRQREVLALRAQGLALKVIGIELDLRMSTVAGHLVTAQRRLGLERWELGNLAADGPTGAPAAAPMHVLRKASLRLTDAEIDVLKCVFEGWSNRRIAADRARSVRTVANQVASGFRKLGVRSRAELFSRYPAGRVRADDAEVAPPPRLRLVRSSAA